MVKFSLHEVEWLSHEHNMMIKRVNFIFFWWIMCVCMREKQKRNQKYRKHFTWNTHSPQCWNFLPKKIPSLLIPSCRSSFKWSKAWKTFHSSNFLISRLQPNVSYANVVCVVMSSYYITHSMMKICIFCVDKCKYFVAHSPDFDTLFCLFRVGIWVQSQYYILISWKYESSTLFFHKHEKCVRFFPFSTLNIALNSLSSLWSLCKQTNKHFHHDIISFWSVRWMRELSNSVNEEMHKWFLCR